MSFWSTREIKANRGHKNKEGGRNRHNCSWCGRKLELGTPAVAFASIWEGDFGHGYFHQECYHACQAVAHLNGGCAFSGDYARGSLLEDGEPMWNTGGSLTVFGRQWYTEHPKRQREKEIEQLKETA